MNEYKIIKLAIAFTMLYVVGSMCLTSGAVTGLADVPTVEIRGDLNGDGYINEDDLSDLRTLRALVPLGVTDLNLTRADMNRDGMVTDHDLNLILCVMHVEEGGLKPALYTYDYIVGDVDGDGVFDLSDLTELLSNTRCSPMGCPWCPNSIVVYNQLLGHGGVIGDVDNDGIFDITDLNVILSNGRCHPFYCPFCVLPPGMSRVVYNQIGGTYEG